MNKMENSSFIEFSIPMTILMELNGEELETFVEKEIEYHKQELAIHAFDQIYKNKTPTIVEVHVEEWDNHTGFSKKIRIHYRLVSVRTMDYFVAEIKPLTYKNHLGIVEWKCLYCGTINTIEATYCGEKHKHAVGCGKSREKTRQEMYD